MGVIIDRENNKRSCECGSCGRYLGPYNSEEELYKNMRNWSYTFVDDMGNTRCPSCIQTAFEDQNELRKLRMRNGSAV